MNRISRLDFCEVVNLNITRYVDAFEAEEQIDIDAVQAEIDQRLFDKMLDWLSVNERFINIQHLRTIIKKEHFQIETALGAIAVYLSGQNFTSKWKRLTEVWKNENTVRENFFKKRRVAAGAQGQN